MTNIRKQANRSVLLVLILVISWCISMEGSSNNGIVVNYDDPSHFGLFAPSDEIRVVGPTKFPRPSDLYYAYDNNYNKEDVIVPYMRPTFGQHRSERDAIFVFAAEYDFKTYLIFCQSLLRTGYQGDIVLGMATQDWEKTPVQEYLKSLPSAVVYSFPLDCQNAEGEAVTSSKGGMRVCQIHDMYGYNNNNIGDKPIKDGREPRTVATIRYELYWLWSQSYDASSWIMLLDARDSYFQSNPFDGLPRDLIEDFTSGGEDDRIGRPSPSLGGRLYFFGENVEATRIGRSSANRKWMETAYGSLVMEALERKPILCSGSTMGQQAAISQYTAALVGEFDATGIKLMGSDQAFHNFLYYSGKLANAEGIADISVMDQGRGIINNLGAMRTRELTEWGVSSAKHEILQYAPNHSEQSPNMTIHNWDGTLSPVIHQFDRHPQLSAYIYKYIGRLWRQAWLSNKKL